MPADRPHAPCAQACQLTITRDGPTEWESVAIATVDTREAAFWMHEAGKCIEKRTPCRMHSACMRQDVIGALPALARAQMHPAASPKLDLIVEG